MACEIEGLKCDFCDRILGSKSGKTNHQRKCPRKIKIGDEKTGSIEAVALTSNDKCSDVNNHSRGVTFEKPAPEPPDPSMLLPSSLPCNQVPPPGKRLQCLNPDVLDRECGMKIPTDGSTKTSTKTSNRSHGEMSLVKDSLKV